MWPHTFFPAGYFAPRYFPPGATSPPPPPAPSMSVAPGAVSVGSAGNALTVTGTNTAWTNATVFNVSAGTLTAQAFVSPTAFTLTYTAPGAVQTVTLSDSTDAAEAALVVGAAPLPGITFRRAYQTWGRRWRYTTVATPLLPNVNAVVAAVDDDRDYLFDFSACPEIVAGLTIVSATIVGGTSPPAAPLTIGTPAVLTQTTAGVAPGQGVQVEISGGTADTLYGLACVARLSNGRTVVVPAQLSVVTDY